MQSLSSLNETKSKMLENLFISLDWNYKDIIIIAKVIAVTGEHYAGSASLKVMGDKGDDVWKVFT